MAKVGKVSAKPACDGASWREKRRLSSCGSGRVVRHAPCQPSALEHRPHMCSRGRQPPLAAPAAAVPTAARAPGLARSRRRCNIRVCSDAHCLTGAVAPAPTTTPSQRSRVWREACVVRHRGLQGECTSARTQRMHLGGVTVCEAWHPTRHEDDVRRAQHLAHRWSSRLGC